MPNRKKKRRFNLAPIWERIHRADLKGTRYEKYANPAPIDPKHPKAPKSHPLTPAEKSRRHPKTHAGSVISYCHRALLFAGKMHYTEDLTARRELFHRPPGEFLGAHADCSQFGATIEHWLGNALVNDTDATGSLWNKGSVLPGPKVGCGVIFGGFPGQHFGFITGKVPGANDWYVVGFGWDGAPDRSTLSGMEEYFRAKGYPGVRFLEFAR